MGNSKSKATEHTRESDAPAGHMDGANVDDYVTDIMPEADNVNENFPTSPDLVTRSNTSIVILGHNEQTSLPRHKNIHQPPHMFLNHPAIPFRHDDASLHATSNLTMGYAAYVPQCSNDVQSFHEGVVHQVQHVALARDGTVSNPISKQQPTGADLTDDELEQPNALSVAASANKRSEATVKLQNGDNNNLTMSARYG